MMWRTIIVGFERWGWIVVLTFAGLAVFFIVRNDAANAATCGFFTAFSATTWRDVRKAKREILSRGRS